jgi:hypothetical protein
MKKQRVLDSPLGSTLAMIWQLLCVQFRERIEATAEANSRSLDYASARLENTSRRKHADAPLGMTNIYADSLAARSLRLAAHQSQPAARY